MDYGIIYLLTNSVMPGLVKIHDYTEKNLNAQFQTFIPRAPHVATGWGANIG